MNVKRFVTVRIRKGKIIRWRNKGEIWRMILIGKYMLESLSDNWKKKVNECK